MNFFTILSIFLIFSLQLSSSFVLGDKSNAIGSESKVLQKSESNSLGYFEKRDYDEPSEEELEESVSTEYHTKTKRDLKKLGSKPCSTCRMKKR
jgi:hypothetical protein